MEWEDIQFGESEEDTGRHILVRHNYTHGKFTSPKNRKERRVDLNKELRRVLIELRDQRILKAMQRSQEPEEISGLVFPSETGGPLDSRNVYHRDFLPCLKAAGLRRVTWHSLRHSFAAHLLIQNQASLTYVKEQMGHSSIQVTVDIYGHLVPGGNIKWIDRLGSPVSKEPEVEPRREEAKVEGAK
jgi:integrase